MVVDPAILPEKLAPSLRDGRPRGTNQEAGCAVSDGRPRGTRLFCWDGRRGTTKDAGSNVSGGRPHNTTFPIPA